MPVIGFPPKRRPATSLPRKVDDDARHGTAVVLMVGRARGAVEMPAVAALRAYVDAEIDGTPRLVVELRDLEVRFVLPRAVLTVEAIAAADRLAAVAAGWKDAVRQLGTDQGVLPL